MISTIKKNLANFITLSSLVCGCVGITEACAGYLRIAQYFLILSLILDFFDGFIARLFKIDSPIGKQLDSLHDLVSFGVLPGVMIFVSLMEMTIEWNQYKYLPVIGLLYPTFTAYRLARFNVKVNNNSKYFEGLPAPAAGLFISSISSVRINESFSNFSFVFLNPISVITAQFVISILMISNIHFFSLKLSFSTFLKQKKILIYILLSILSITILKNEGIIISTVVYIFLSLFYYNRK